MERSVVLVCLVLGLGACDTAGLGAGGGAGENAGGPGGNVFGLTGWATLRSLVGDITYHSGYDGQNAYQVPLAFVGEGEPSFTIADPGIASVIATLPIDDPRIPEGVTVRAVLIGTNGAGTTTVTGSVGGVGHDATLVVNAYSPADVTLGDQRYNAPANANADTRRSCNSCHETLQKHSTAFMADLTDDEVLRTAAAGVGVQLRDPNTGNITEYNPNDGNHMWDLTPAERTGIVAYLRSRPPFYQLPL